MDRTEFIGKLQMVYVGDRNAIDELVGVYDNLKQENQRLNNVLNELEKKLIEDYNWLDKYGDAPAGCAMGEINRIKKKLNELKESDK